MKPVSRVSLLVFLIGLWLAHPGVYPATTEAAPASPPFDMQVRIDPGELTVGDLATYTLTVRHDPAIRLKPPQAPPWEGFERIDQGLAAPRQEGERLKQEYWFRLRADQVGFHTLEGPILHFEAPDAENPDRLIPGEARAPDIKVQIRSVLYREGEPRDIHDIKPIAGAAPWWYRYLGPVAGLLLAGLIAGWLVERWVKKHRLKPKAPPPPPPVSIQELALRELQRLYDLGYLDQGRFRELYFELSEIFRRYLGARYGFPALDWTTEEIAWALNRHPEAPAEIRARACELLNETDLVKFARVPVSAEQALAHMKAVAEFVRRTAPKDKEPAPAVSSGEEAA